MGVDCPDERFVACLVDVKVKQSSFSAQCHALLENGLEHYGVEIARLLFLRGRLQTTAAMRRCLVRGPGVGIGMTGVFIIRLCGVEGKVSEWLGNAHV
jgi:hypothetical protein